MRRRFWGIFAVVALASLALSTAALAEGSELDGKPAPQFSVKDVAGNTLTLSELVKDKIVWLNFWGLRCGPCVRELPALQMLHEKYSGKGLLIVGVNTDGVAADFITKSFAEREDLKPIKITFPLVPDAEFALIDAYQLMGAPLNVMIDHEGVIRYYREGYENGDEAHYEEILKKLLGL
jgi:peroxiredoxin